jgi:methyl-accepting chemotaxis protein
MEKTGLHQIRVRLVGAPIGFTLSLILLFGLIPALVMGYYFVSASRNSIEIARQELHGVKLLRQLEPVGHFIISPPVEPAAIKSKASAAWNKLNRAKRFHGYAKESGTEKQFDAVLGKLQMMADGYAADPRPTYDALVTRIGDQSGLILDPELESYYLMDIVVLKSRRLARAARELRDVRQMTNDSRNPVVQISRHRLSDAARDLQSSALSAIKGNTDGTLARSNFLGSINATVTAANKFVASEDLWSSYWVLVDANRMSWNTAADALDRSVENRIDRVSNEIYSALAVCGLVLLTAIILAGLVIAAITSGLRQISQRLDLMSLGDYTSDVPGTEYKNDIGVIAGALQNFVDMSGEVDAERSRARAELEETVDRVKRENGALLTQALQQQSQAQELEREAVGKLAAQMERQMSSLLLGSRAAAEQMDREASLMATSASGVQREASAAAVAANEIRRSVEAVAPEVQAVAAQLQGYTRSLGEAKEMARDAVTRVDVAKARMSDFETATGKASSMLDLIAKVAHKTNMLALNASIEAVRVGEAGKGFMVVAEEVKALARSTREAAQEISSQIRTMESANNAVTDAFGEVLNVVNTLAEQSNLVAGGMDDQATAIIQVNEKIATATAELSIMVSSINSADISASAAILKSSEMLSASKSVSNTVGSLDQSIRSFLGGIQGARNAA